MSPHGNDVTATTNFDHTQNIKQGTNVQAVKAIITEYCNDSSIHGFKYIGGNRRPVIERIVWAIALLVSVSVCYHFIKSDWDIHSRNPVIITFDERLTDVREIPFPTVTICPEIKTNPRIFNFTDVLFKKLSLNRSLTSEEAYFMDVVGQMCPDPSYSILYNNTKNTSVTSEVIEAMTRVSLTFEEIVFMTVWREIYLNFGKKDFHKVLTEEGPCYSFNSYDAKAVYREEALVEGTSFDDDNDEVLNWSLDSGFNTTQDTTYPIHALGLGVKEGLTLLLTGNPEDSDVMCQGPFKGFKLILSTPGEVPQVSNQYLSIPFNQKVAVSIKPEIVFTSKGLRNHNPERRQCYFQDERYLRYFKVYTHVNCELECLSNFTLETCGCVKFHMPRTESVPVCGLQGHFCFYIMNKYLVLQQYNEMQKTRCNCLPTCSTMQYKAELEDISPLENFSLWPYANMNYNSSATVLSISFKEKAFKALRRSERYTLIEFIASCGGLLGLFMGVSILSVLELLSFFTIRLCSNLTMTRKKRLETTKAPEANANNPPV